MYKNYVNEIILLIVFLTIHDCLLAFFPVENSKNEQNRG